MAKFLSEFRDDDFYDALGDIQDALDSEIVEAMRDYEQGDPDEWDGIIARWRAADVHEINRKPV